MKNRHLLLAVAAVGLALLITVLALFALPRDDHAAVFQIGLLLNVSDTGDPDTQVATRLALEDLAAYFPGGSPPFEVKLTVRGTGLDPDVARSEVETFAEQGIRVVIGPESSAELEAIRSFTDAEDMVVVSHCASAPSLAIEHDSIYRLVPSDAHQAEALASLMHEAGIRAIVPLWRADIWGDGISAALREAFSELGGEAYGGVRYDPEASSYQSDMNSVSDQVVQARARSGDAVAVVFLGFGPEAPAILSEAGLHDPLRATTWYGSEGSVLSREIVQDADAARFALETGFLHPMFADVQTPHAEDVRARISSAIGGGSVHYCAMAAYDAVWLVALSAAVAGTDNGDAFEGALRALADGYEGASGRTTLDAADDRAKVPYDLWTIGSDGDGFIWMKVTMDRTLE